MALEQTTTCPTCKLRLESAGRTERCKQCDGAWIGEDVLVGMMQESTSSFVVLPWHPREQDRDARPCAVCDAAMQPVKLGTVALDRCAQHGVWFDANELESLFEEAKDVAHEGRARSQSDVREPGQRGLFGAIARLFGR